jgi:hypothetical protein
MQNKISKKKLKDKKKSTELFMYQVISKLKIDRLFRFELFEITGLNFIYLLFYFYILRNQK